MFGIKELRDRVCDLEEKVKELRDPVVGEIYCKCYYDYQYFYSPADSVNVFERGWVSWVLIRKSDIQDICPDGKIKFKGTWFPKEHFIFYNNIDAKKKNVEKLVKGG